MKFAKKSDGSWRAVDGAEDLAADEILVDEQPAPYVDLAEAARAQRAVLLAKADFAVNRGEDSGTDTKAWRTYRQALRDLTDQPAFPVSITWPVAPDA